MGYIELLEQQITERLRSIETDNIFVHKSPETDEQREEQSGSVANLFVMYTGSRYGEPRSTNQVSQDEYLQIAVVIESPLLRGDYGIYQLKKKVSDTLLGFVPDNSERLTLVSSGYNVEKMEQNQGIFTFTVGFETKSIAVQAIPEPEDWGIVNKIEFNGL